MKNYLKEILSDEERAELISIIWRVAKKYKLKIYEQQKRKFSIIDDLDLQIEDTYNLDNLDIKSFNGPLKPLRESEKTDIVNKLNMLMGELKLYELKRTLTFNEKLVFFLISIERLKGVEVMKLLSVDKKTVYNRRKSIESKINKLIGGVHNEGEF